MTGRPAPALRAGRLPDAADAVAVLQRLDTLAGQDFELELLTGGLTNRNYRVITRGGAQYVARFSSVKTSLLAIDREAEFHNSTIAAAAGVGPAVAEFAPDEGVLLVEWIAGRTFAPADLDDQDQLGRLADVCRRLHAAPVFASDFDMFAVQQRYLAIVRELGFRLPEDYLSFEPIVARVEQVLRGSALDSVPCHNDLLAANIMDDGERIWLIDFEYSGNNDPCFELGNIWSEAVLGVDRLEHLVTSYFGVASPVQTARARLFGLMANYGWTLWASIQSSVSDVDFDFWEWGLEKYARARSEFQSAEFDDLISTIRESIRTEGAKPWPTPSR
ncbi:MAG: phosphotransferase [Jatrophihabitans sp.]|uniref:phosphotransferase n=1 Tax=Jatrophihabitans sp. TaxID=1932789 RepID=UPI003912845C